MTTMLKTFGITFLLLSVLIFNSISAQTVSPQCRQPPTLIPDTFSISYQPISEKTGTIYFSYLEPAWENWPMFDIRELASEPFRIVLNVSLLQAYIDQFSTNDCVFTSPQSFLRADSYSAHWTDSLELQLTLSQTGSLACPVTFNSTNFNTQGKQQQSVQGQMYLKQYVCDSTTLLPTSLSTPLIIDGASKISLPDLFMHVPCSRLTLNFQSTSQLTLKQTNGIALDIDKHPALVVEPGQTAITRLHSYSVSQTNNQDKFGQTIYQNQLSFCSFNSSLSSEFDPSDLFALNTNLNKVSYSIKSSKIPSYCFDGVKNFDESDIDCGGTGKLNGCPPCVDSSQLCQGNADCVSNQCVPHQLAGKRCYAYSDAITSVLSVTVMIISALAVIFM